MTATIFSVVTSSESAVDVPVAHVTSEFGWAALILWLPALSTVLCGLCAAMKVKTKAPGWITVGLLGASFLVTLALFFSYVSPVIIHVLDWLNISWAGDGGPVQFVANFALYVDSLTLLWMLFVTGLGTLIAFYATEYMEVDVGKGYARFFAGISVFLFAMTALVLGDNLVMLYLGWEGVGFASYWLIGYYYKKPSAVAAAKKAFIVNRIGDLGLVLGIYFIWHNFGTVEYSVLFEALNAGGYATEKAGWSVHAIPYLLMLGAFGKSAQLPLYVWLPDAMEGPTPVSALIHAATMVTAGVYLLARMYPVMLLDQYALPTVAWIGGLTALLAATIGMAQYDIKRIFAYSTISQLGYMFLGLGVLTSFGAAYHVFTHAFFKAVLFLSAGAVMHGFAGQLDLRKVSGLRHMPGWRIVSWTMFYACLCLVGFPLISSGFYSKDMIMTQVFLTDGPGYTALGVIAVFTALLTAYYAFRVWFRVCAGPEQYKMGDEGHGDGHDQPRPPRLAINITLILITVGAVLSILLKDWAGDMVTDSSAAAGMAAEHHVEGGWFANPHNRMSVVASTVTIIGIAIAWYFHLANRSAAERAKNALLANSLTRWLPTAMENKWYVDELYHATVRSPLWIFGHFLNLFDRYVVDMFLVDGIAKLPRALARTFQPLQNGILQSYAVSMAGGVALVALLVVLMPLLVLWARSVIGGAG